MDGSDTSSFSSPCGWIITQSYAPLEVVDKNKANAAGAADRCNRRDRKPYNAAGGHEILDGRACDRREAGRHRGSHHSDHDGARAVTLEWHFVETAQHFHHPDNNGSDAGDIRNRERNEPTGCRIGSMALDDCMGLR